VIFALLSVLAALVVVPAAWGDSHARIVRLSYVEGDVQIDRADGQGFQSALLNLPVTQGARLETHDDGRAEVEFEDSSTLRIVPDTAISFDQLGLRDSGAKFTSVVLVQGTAYFDLRKKNNDEFRIAAGRGIFELQGGARGRVTVDPSGIRMAVFDGEVKFDAPDRSITVKKNETLETDQSDRYSVANSIAPEPYDSWIRERDDYRKHYANNAQVLSSPYSYGSTDLNYYGNFFNSSYGYLWRPWNATSAWDPFADGAWVFYPGFGYSWVSGHAWGWLPYHYGSWIYYQPYGWCWQPGRLGNNWSPVAIVRNPHPGFVLPHPPARPPGNGSHVIAVGRGPNRGILRNPPLEAHGDLGFETRSAGTEGPRSSSVPNSQGLLKWPGPTIRLPNGTEAGNGMRQQELDNRGLFSRRPTANPRQLVAPLVPSTLAPLRPTSPSSSSVIHWPSPVTTQPRVLPPARTMSSPHIMSSPSMRTSAPHSSRR
jgi:hypothetical protein